MDNEELKTQEEKFFSTNVEGNWEQVVAEQPSTQETQE